VVACLAAGIACTIAGSTSNHSTSDVNVLPMGIVLLVAGTIQLALFWGWWEKISLASSLLRVSAHGLADNPALVGTSVGLTLLSMVVVAPLCFVHGRHRMRGAGQ